jgi:hypothetical protein
VFNRSEFLVHTSSLVLSRLGWDESYALAFDVMAPESTVPARVVFVASRTVTVVADTGP